MAALTAASWTVVITKIRIEGQRRKVRGTLTLAAVDTYPTGGIPLPVAKSLGLQYFVDEVRIVGETGATSQYLTSYDPTNHKLQLFEEEAAAAGGPLLEADAAEVPGARIYHFVAEGW